MRLLIHEQQDDCSHGAVIGSVPGNGSSAQKPGSAEPDGHRGTPTQQVAGTPFARIASDQQQPAEEQRTFRAANPEPETIAKPTRVYWPIRKRQQDPDGTGLNPAHDSISRPVDQASLTRSHKGVTGIPGFFTVQM
jgi:hypothetical protein